jgi:hypothetical protein
MLAAGNPSLAEAHTTASSCVKRAEESETNDCDAAAGRLDDAATTPTLP